MAEAVNYRITVSLHSSEMVVFHPGYDAEMYCLFEDKLWSSNSFTRNSLFRHGQPCCGFASRPGEDQYCVQMAQV